MDPRRSPTEPCDTEGLSALAGRAPRDHPWVRHPLFALVVVVGLAAVLRVGIALLSGPTWFPIDTRIYLDQGRQIAEGTPYAYLPNGFPLVIAALWLLAGQAGVLDAILVVNVIASVVAVGLTYGIGREVAGPYAGALAALTVALYPNQLHFVRLIMSEVTATVLLVAAVFLILRRHALASGVALALATLVRTTLLPATPALLVVLLVFRRGTRKAGAFTLGAALVAGLHAALLFTNTIAPAENFDYNVLLSISATSSEGMGFSKPAFQARFSEEEQARPFATYFRFAAEHPGAFVRQRLSALWELWGPWPSPGDPEHPRRFPIRLLLGLRFLLIVPAVWAFARHIREERAWIVATPILVITVAHTVSFATPRFTYVVEPLAIVLASWLAADFWDRRRRAELNQTEAVTQTP